MLKTLVSRPLVFLGGMAANSAIMLGWHPQMPREIQGAHILVASIFVALLCILFARSVYKTWNR